jgi:hypothetical protein
VSISIVPANQASCDDLQAIFGARGPAVLCQCQRFKLRPREAFRNFPSRSARTGCACRPSAETRSPTPPFAAAGFTEVAARR